MTQKVVTTRCACGWETVGAEPDAVAATIEHGRYVHTMEATPEQILATAVPVEATAHAMPQTDAS